MAIELRPVTREIADDYIRQHHRHHGVPVGALWRQAVHDDSGRLVGIAISGRPVARALDDGLTVEVTRLCTDGTPNACSMLYAAARRVAQDKGYRRGLTYILATEEGASLRAAGWRFLWHVKGRSWDCPSRPRTDKHPTDDKQAWGWGSWPEKGAAQCATTISSCRGGQYECIKVEQILPQGTVMPDWCPLPAYPKQQTTPTQQDTVLADVRDMLSGALIATGPAQAIMVADAITTQDSQDALSNRSRRDLETGERQRQRKPRRPSH